MDVFYKIFIRDGTVRDYNAIFDHLTAAGFEVEVISPFSKDRVPTSSATKYLKIKKKHKKTIFELTALLLTVTTIAANVKTVFSDPEPSEKVRIEINESRQYNVTITTDGATYQIHGKTLEEVQSELDTLKQD